ncbi:DUF4145 domain-containing protein [Streptomyces spororaveus]|uniref:DUF4145 domain-containing protein n=1 Tax=Streptomyces spororaveus TaxID=284039 RepID=UPI0036809CDD
MPNMLIKDLRAIAGGLPEDVKEWPDIPCPTCGRGSLSSVTGTFVMEESETSKRWQAEQWDHWEPDWIHGGFHCVLRCGKSTCDLVRVTGEMRLVAEQDERGHWDGQSWVHEFRPLFFHPALPLLQTHEAAPEVVLQRVSAASAVLWADPSSAANRLRSAVEALMDDQGIPRKGSGRRGPFDLTLHKRIENLASAKPAYSDAAEMILAVKWIGNVGSHEDALKVSNVLDGAEILDFVLTEIYDKSRDSIKRLAAEITARKGAPAARYIPGTNLLNL